MQPLEIHRRYFDLKVILILIFLIITIFSATRSRSQEKVAGHKFLSIDIQGSCAVSLGDFFNKSGHLTAWGIHTSLLYHPVKTDKFYFGIGFIYYNYGIEDYTQSVMIGGTWDNFDTFRNYNIFFPSLNARIMPWDDLRIVPVLDAFIGPMAFSTVSTFSYGEDQCFLFDLLGFESEETVVKNIESLDWTWGYGFSVGMNYFLNPVMELELNLGYTDGHDVNYLTRKDIRKDPATGTFAYLPRRSDTDMISIGFGIRFNLF